jgi:Gpi18-like mannosyltransferase
VERPDRDIEAVGAAAGGPGARLAGSSRLVVGTFALAAVLAFSLTLLPDTMGDLGEYCRWTRRLAAHGLEGAYFPSPAERIVAGADPSWPIDYPPLLPYLLWAIGHIADWFAPGSAQQDRLMGFLIRVPFVLAHLTLGVVIFRYVAREGGRRAAWLTTVAHLFNPAILFDTCYWGQADALLALILVAAVVAATRGRLEWAWAMLVIAALLKPLAYPHFALLVVVTLKHGGPRRAVRCGAIAAMTGIAALAPFLWIGRLPDILRWIVYQVDSMPFASANAHNLWWLLTGGLPWTVASDPFLLGLSYQQAGVLLFGVFLAVTMAQLSRARSVDALPLAAAGTALGFLVLNTHLHENHLFAFLPLLSLVAFRERRLRWIYAAATATLLVNMVAHDPYLRFVIGPHLPGPSLTMPSAKWAVDATLAAHFVQHGYAHVVEVERGLTTWLRLALTFVGSEANVLLLMVWLRLRWRRWPLAEQAGRLTRRRAWGWSLAAIVALALTAAPFFIKSRAFVRRQYFLAHLHEARAVGDEDGGRWGTFEIGRRQRWVLLASLPSELRYSVTLAPSARLALGAALGPARDWPTKASAVRFEVEVVGSGSRETVFDSSIDPPRNSGEPTWREAVVDLSRYGGRPVEIVFRTSGGDSGADARGNVGWIEPGFL